MVRVELLFAIQNNSESQEAYGLFNGFVSDISHVF